MPFAAPRRALLVLTASIGLGGCTAIRTGVVLQEAVVARDAAVAKGSEQLAPYEHTLCARYLEKAWEEFAAGEQKAAVQLSRKSVEWADLATAQAERARRAGGLEAIRDAPAPPEAP